MSTSTLRARSNPRVLVIIGTRPEGVKLGPVVRALNVRSGIDTHVAATGQHMELLDQVLGAFDIAADYNLRIMRPKQDLYHVARECLTGVRELLTRCRPDLLLVQGDTASVFFSALTGFFENVGVGHVEAGLRSGDKRRPFPEEVLRQLTGVVTDLHFAPTPAAGSNLLREGIPPANVFVTGNPVVDAVRMIGCRAHDVRNDALRAALGTGRRLLLVTAHRRESFGGALRQAFTALRSIADEYADVQMLYPVHPNPNVVQPARDILAGHERITLTTPLDYLDLVHALKHARLVFTDSGGIQEEAPSFGVPVLVLREVTERPEGVRAGAAVLVGTNPTRIITEARRILDSAPAPFLERTVSPYGDGRAAERIADIVVHRLTGAPRQTEDLSGSVESYFHPAVPEHAPDRATYAR